MILRLFIMLVIVGAVIGGIAYSKYEQWQAMSETTSEAQQPVTVATAEVKKESWQLALDSVGSLVAINDVHITNEVAGKVANILFESGQHVDKGDVILQLDDEVDRAELVGLQAELKLAQVQYNRASKLVKERSLSQSEFDEANARLESARANANSKQELIAQKKIRAPFSGQLGIRQVDLGEYLAPGAQIVLLQSLDPIYVDYTLPERHLSELSVDQTVEIGVQARPGEIYEGRILALDPGVDPGTRSIRIRARLDNPNHRLRPGMFAEVRTLLPRRNDVLTLPQRAITYAPYGDSVFVVVENDGQQIVKRRQVKVGAVRNSRIEILSGLEEGDIVVSAGQNKLRNEQLVRIDNSVEIGHQQVIQSP